MSRLINQLRLVRAAAERLGTTSTDPDAKGTLAAMSGVLAELIVADEMPLGQHADSITGEAGHWAAVRARVEAPVERADDTGGGQELDNAALQGFLATLPGEEAIKVVSSRTVSRGMSKKTVLATLSNGRVLPDRIALRIDRSANNYLGTTVLEEYPIVEMLWNNGARVPQPHALEATGKVLGDAFIVFSAVDGVPVGGNYVPPARNPALIEDVARCMAGVHAIPVDPWPRPDQLRGIAHFDDALESHLADWQALGERSAIMDAAFDRIIRDRALAKGPDALVHEDFNFNNMLVEGNRVSAVLDWEFAHIGVAAADLAYLRYSADAGSSFAELLAAYEKAGGTVPSTEQLDFYTLWGQLRLAVMGFKAVRGFEEGRFDDVRFGVALGHRRRGLIRVANLLAA
jgi:aminoglycoside phosphotransferase (APT) family kinase protein